MNHHSALVRPRIRGGGPDVPDPGLLTDWIDARLACGATGLVHLVGAPGSGRRTALALARAHVATRGGRALVLEDASRAYTRVELERLAQDALVVRVESAWPVRPAHAGDVHLELAPWSRDEIVEYLLAAHRARAGELLARFEAARDVVDPAGHAGTVRAVLDAFARDAALAGVHDVIERVLLPDDAAREWPLVRACRSARAFLAAATHTAGGFVPDLDSVDAVRIAADLAGAEPGLPERLVERSTYALETSARQLRLVAIVADPSALRRWIARAWARTQRVPALERELLPGLALDGAWLRWLRATESDFSTGSFVCCDLRDARFAACRLRSVDFTGAELSSADFEGSLAPRVRFDDVRATKANFDDADLSEASFVRASLRRATFAGADLSGAVFREADLTQADLRARALSCEFHDCVFEHARLAGVDLRAARLSSRRFRGVDLEDANLEGMRFDDVDFSRACLVRARLGGSVWTHPRLVDADLSGAYLADVSWVGADLTGADLRGAVFRAGTTRSGLLHDAPPMEGSRTGFYTPEERDLLHLAPEDVRVADLRNSILSDACVIGVDFRLVDLRGAVCSREQREHFRRTGAILDP